MCLSSTWLITGDVGLDHLAQVVSTRFPQYTVTFPFLPGFPNCTLGSKSLSLPEKGYLHDVIVILLHRRLEYPISLFNHLVVSVYIEPWIYVFYTLDYNPKLCFCFVLLLLLFQV